MMWADLDHPAYVTDDLDIYRNREDKNAPPHDNNSTCMIMRNY